MEWTRAGRGVARSRRDMIELRVAPGKNADARTDRVAVAFRPFQVQRKPVIATRSVIYQELGGRSQGSYDNVELAVPVEIANGRTTMTPGWLRGEAGTPCQSGPLDSGEVAEDRVVLVDLADALHGGRLHISATHEDILPTVVVEVCDVGAVARHRLAQQGHTGLRGDLSEGALANILIERKSLVGQG